MSTKANPSPAPPAPGVIAEVKYSLPAMLRELAVERAASSFAKEKLDQVEIGKLFKAKPPRRVKTQK